MTRVVITGVGPVSSVGVGKENFWEGIIGKKTNVRLKKVMIDGKLWGEFYTHAIENFEMKNFDFDKNKIEEIMQWKEKEEIIDLNYFIVAIKLALQDSGLKYDAKKNDISLVLAHENLGIMPFGLKVSNLAYEFLQKKEKFHKRDFFDTFYKLFLKSGYELQTFTSLFHVARLFNIHNYSLFINNACASGLYAIEAGAQIIRSGYAKNVVVASSDYSDIYKYFWFHKLGIYSPDGVIRPFCKDCNGLVFGDGGASIILEDLEHAKKRKSKIYAEYLGGGFDLEGWKMTFPKIGSDSYKNAIRMAFKKSKIKISDVDFLCPHGVGARMIDCYEAKAMTDIFGKDVRRPLITTFKPYFGHNLGCSALLETIALLISLDENIIPPSLNIDCLNPKLNINLVDQEVKCNLKIAMKICCAFAGYNAASIFKKLY